MTPDGPLKILFLAAFFFLATVAIATARRASARHGGVASPLHDEVRGLIWVRAALGMIFYAALAIWLFGIPGFAWAYLRVPVGIRWAAAALLVLTLLFLTWCYRTLGTNYRGGVALHDTHELVTTGPYRYLRHPIYLGFIVMMVCAAFISGSWVLGLSGSVLVIGIAAARVPEEERRLFERFAAGWESYRSRTGAFFPSSPRARAKALRSRVGRDC